MDILTETSKAVFNTWIVDLKQMKKVAEKKHLKLRNKISRKQKNLDNTVENMIFGYQASPTIMNRVFQAENEIKKLETERDAIPLFPDPKTIKRSPFSHFIKTSTPEAILEVIDSATVSFDDKQLHITDIKPNWDELKNIMA